MEQAQVPRQGQKERMEKGTRLLEAMWYNTADTIVSTAISLYKLDREQASQLRRIYLRPNDYIVKERSS